MIAASRGDRGVSVSTIYKETEALTASPLEHVASDLDRLVREGAHSRAEFILRWLCDRHGYDLVARSTAPTSGEIASTVSEIARRSGEGVSDAIESLSTNGIEAHEVPALIRHARKNIEGWHRFIRQVEAVGTPNVRAFRSA